MKEIGDLILQVGLGAAAIIAVTYIAVKLINCPAGFDAVPPHGPADPSPASNGYNA